MVAAYYESGGPDGQRNLTAFLEYLDSIYIDLNAVARAIDLLRTMRQRAEESFTLFLPRFEKALAEAQLGGAPE